MSRPPGSPSPWLACYKPNPAARVRLFCFPFAGGGASVYRVWAGDLPSDVEVCPVQLPGRETRMREPAIGGMDALIAAAAPALRPLMDMPFCFFGHSMGAVVSFELARHLRRTDGPMPLGMFVSGRRAPHVPNPDPPKFDLPESEFIEEIQRLNGTPDEALQSRELMQLMLPVLRADCEVIDTYTYVDESPFSIPVTAFGGLTDDEAPRDEMDAWSEQTSGRFVLRMLPGDHFFLQTARTSLTGLIARDLQQLLLDAV